MRLAGRVVPVVSQRSYATNINIQKDIIPYVAPGVSRMTHNLFVEGKGSYLYDSNGDKWLDFACGIAVTNTGHCHPKIAAAAAEQCHKVVHLQAGMGFHEPGVNLIKKLQKITPPGLDNIYFANSGSEAVESALKVAKHYTKKPHIITFTGSFHGRTNGAMAMTNSKTIYRAGFGPFMPGIFVAPFPYCLHCPCSQFLSTSTSNKCCNFAVTELENMLKMQTSPDEVAAILIEPVLGEGGYVWPNEGFWKDLRRICDKHKILLIADEVQTGFGRTGKWFGVEHFGVTPDIMIMAKGIASGYPLSAIATRREIWEKQPVGSMGGTYIGNAVACAAGCATIDVINEEKLLDNANRMGHLLLDGFNRLKSKYPIWDVRGKGLMVGIEFDQSCKPGTAGAITKKCLEHRLLLLTAGAFETIRIIPPLNVKEDEVKYCLDAMDKAMNAVFANK